MKLVNRSRLTVLWIMVILLIGKCDLIIVKNPVDICLDCLESQKAHTCNIPFCTLNSECKNKIDFNDTSLSETNNLTLICRGDNSLTFEWSGNKNLYYFMEYYEERSNASLFTNLTNCNFATIYKLISNQKYAVKLYSFSMESKVLVKNEKVTEYTTKLLAHRTSVGKLNYTLKLLNDSYTATATWKPGADLSCLYEIRWYRKKGQPGNYYHRKVDLRTQQIPEYVIPNLDFGKKYIFEIMSVNRNGEKESSLKVLNIAVPSCLESYKNVSICTPDTPKNLTLIKYPNKNSDLFNITIGWNLPKFKPEYYIAKFVRKMEVSSINFTTIILNISGMNNYADFRNIELGIFNRIMLTAYSDGGVSNSVYLNVPHQNTSNDPLKIEEESTTNHIKSIWIWTTFLLGIVMVILALVFRSKIRIFLFKYLDLNERMDGTIVKYVVNNTEDLKWELNETKLTLNKVVGVGAFGIVQEGWYYLEPDKKSEVAIKMLKARPTEDQISQFYNEIEIMKSVPSHPHIVYLIGVITKCRPDNPLMLVEYCANGDLQTFLRNVFIILGDSYKNGKHTDTAMCSDNCAKYSNTFYDKEESALKKKEYILQSKDLLSFARQIIVGMEFLSSLKMIHRDLAARNILLTENYTIKISDFGLCRDIYTNNFYQKVTGGKLPFRWMALESLTHQVYTAESDVWSFGIVLWEIVTLGGNPFPAVKTENLISLLKGNYRMENPINCSEELYHIMLRCWEGCPSLRPTFKELREIFDKLLESEMQYISLEDVQKLDLNYYENINNSIGLALSKRYIV